MFKKSHPVIVLAILALTFSTLACGASASSQPVEEEPAQSVPTTEPPVAGNDTNSNATIPCSQLIAPDDVNLLLNTTNPMLNNHTYAGGTSCEWQYTPNGETQTKLFYVQVDFTVDAVSLWESTRKSELSNEPSDIVVISINGLGDENYTWVSQPSGQRAVYVRKGGKTLIMRFAPDVLFLQTESGIIDYSDRIFNRF